MSKTIIYSFFLAGMALLCSATAVFFEVAAEKNRLTVEALNISILQQDPFRRVKMDLMFKKELEFSQIQSVIPFRVRPSFIAYNKEALFFAGVSVLKLELSHLKNINWENSFTPELKEEAKVLLEDIDLFLLTFQPERLALINLDEYSERFDELQSLVLRLSYIGRKGIESMQIKSQQFEKQAQALSTASTYLIFIAFLMELLIFILIQFLEVRTERRIR